MGARVNVEVQYKNEPSIFLYSHWGGSELALKVKKALAKRERWDDPQYLTRIIFCQMVGKDWEMTTGYGIAPYPGEESFPTVRVNTENHTVTIGGKLWTFEEYIAESDETIEANSLSL